MKMIKCENVNLADVLVIVALSASLILSLFMNRNELSMSIASGLLGYIGGAGKHAKANDREEKESQSLSTKVESL